jgi:tetratricopeptide (TPR) repeat protein
MPVPKLLASDLAIFEGHFSLALDHIRRLREFRRDDSSVFHSQSLPEMDVALGNVAADLYLILDEPQKALSELEAVQPPDEGAARWIREAIHIRVLSRLAEQSETGQTAELQEQALKLQRLLESDFARRLNEGAQPEDAAAALRQPTSSLAHTAFTVGMYTLSLQLCQRQLEMSPYAVNLPGIYCLIGECQTALGKQEDARAAWRTAVGLGIDTYRARVAAQHLAALQNTD